MDDLAHLERAFWWCVILLSTFYVLSMLYLWGTSAWDRRRIRRIVGHR